MPYKLKKIIYQCERKSCHETHTYPLNTEIEFPYVVGEIQDLVPKKQDGNRENGRLVISDCTLFNQSNLTKLIPEVGPNGIYYLELRPGYILNQLLVEPDDVVKDLLISATGTLIYSFYNPTSKNHITITASTIKDKSNAYAKIKDNPKDIHLRQYFVRLAQDQIDIGKSNSKVSENMTVKEVAEYLSLEIKTIRNWTSEGKIPSVKLGGAVRYNKERIDVWLKSKEKKLVRNNSSK